MEVLLVLAVLAVAVLVISAPLRAGTRSAAQSGEAVTSADRAELEAERDAKYREIRDAELDYRTGKLSHEDWQALDSSLRAEAVALLRRLDALGQRESRAGVDPGRIS
jgi:hypothetical protein